MVLDLEGSWADARVAKEVKDQRSLEVGDTDGTGDLVVNQLFHGGPGLLDGGVGELDRGLAIVVPSWWVADGWINVLQGDWEVDEVQVEVLKTPVSELLAGNWANLVLVVERVPELGNNEELLALDEAVLDGAGNTLTSLLLVAVVAGSVKETVAGLDGVVDSVGTGVVADLPEAEANLWHLIAGVELDSWNHVCGLCWV